MTYISPMLREDFPYIPLPEVFYPFESKEPFCSCSRCKRSLLSEDVEYIIEKALKPGDTIYEYAVCFACIEDSRSRISADSSAVIEGFFRERMRPLNHREEMLSKYDLNTDLWLDRCIVTGKRVSEMDEYQILGHAQGPFLVFSMFPYALGEEASKELTDLISPETMDEMDDFADELIDIPPELRELWKRNPVFL